MVKISEKSAKNYKVGKGKPPLNKSFKPGQSGNPKGRPKKLPQLDKLLADVLGEETKGVTAGEAILKALRAKASRGDVKAAELLLDRAYGKVKQEIDQNLNVLKPIVIDWSDNIQSDGEATTGAPAIEG